MSTEELLKRIEELEKELTHIKNKKIEKCETKSELKLFSIKELVNWAYEYDVKISNIKGTLIDTIWKSIKKYDFSSDNSDGSSSDDSSDSDDSDDSDDSHNGIDDVD